MAIGENIQFLTKYTGTADLGNTVKFTKLTGVTTVPELTIDECLEFEYTNDPAIDAYFSRRETDLISLISSLFALPSIQEDVEVYAKSVSVDASNTDAVAKKLVGDIKTPLTSDQKDTMSDLLNLTLRP